MNAADPSVQPADALLEEMRGMVVSAGTSAAPSMQGRLKRCNYTHEAMVDLIIAKPEMSQGELAAHFGYSQGWISVVLASDAFQEKLALRRSEVVNPELKASVEERFRAVTIRSLQRLQEKLDAPQVSDNVVLKAAELGARALGIGGNAPAKVLDSGADRLERLAGRLLALQAGVRGETYHGEAREIPDSPEGAEVAVQSA